MIAVDADAKPTLVALSTHLRYMVITVDGTIRALGPIVMSYSVRTRSTAREGIGGVDHDERRGTDFLGWFYAPPHARNDSGVTWTRHASSPPTTSRG